MPSLTNVNPNPEGLLVLLDGRLKHVPKGETLDVSETDAKALLTQPDNWHAEKARHEHLKKESK